MAYTKIDKDAAEMDSEIIMNTVKTLPSVYSVVVHQLRMPGKCDMRLPTYCITAYSQTVQVPVH